LDKASGSFDSFLPTAQAENKIATTTTRFKVILNSLIRVTAQRPKEQQVEDLG